MDRPDRVDVAWGVEVPYCQGVLVLSGYCVNVIEGVGVPANAVSVRFGVPVGVLVSEGVRVSSVTGVGVSTGGVIVPLGVTVATGVCCRLTSVAYCPDAVDESRSRNTSRIISKFKPGKYQPRGSAL